jgi:peroxiredoxin
MMQFTAAVAEPRHVSHRQWPWLWQFYRMSAPLRHLPPCLIAWLGAFLAIAGSPAVAAAPAAAAPDFALKALDGHNYRLSEYRGEVVAIVFWASWCGGCRRELERLQRLGDIYGDAGLQVLGVAVDVQAEQARSLATAVGVSFPQLLDPSGSVSRSYRLENLPAIVLVGRAGFRRATHGEIDAQAEAQLLAELRMLLDE